MTNVLQDLDAKEQLSRILFDKMEHLDPEGVNWNSASEDERNFCRSCIERLRLETDLLKRLIAN